MEEGSDGRGESGGGSDGGGRGRRGVMEGEESDGGSGGE